MTGEDLYDLAIQCAWDDLYELADFYSAQEWPLVFEIYTTGYIHGAIDIAEARIEKLK